MMLVLGVIRDFGRIMCVAAYLQRSCVLWLRAGTIEGELGLHVFK